MLACKDVTRLWATEEIRRAPLMRKLAVRIHLLMCRHCRRYLRELAAIGAAARSLANRLGNTDGSSADLERRVIAAVRGTRSHGPGGS